MKSLKTQNNKYLWTFILFNIILFAFFYVDKNFSYKILNNIWLEFSAKEGILFAIAPLLTIIINGIISSNIKAMIVFWRFHFPLPGSRVFTTLFKNDLRINMQKIQEIYGDLPVKPAEQNKLWYKIYKKNRNDITIIDAHKVFLLLRDISSFSFIAVFLFPLASIIITDSFSLVYFLILIIQYTVTSLSAKNYGNRFVLNVLAVES